MIETRLCAYCGVVVAGGVGLERSNTDGYVAGADRVAQKGGTPFCRVEVAGGIAEDRERTTGRVLDAAGIA